MEDTANTFNKKTSNFISRNRPVAIIINCCTFLGSSLTGYLLEKGIQVIAIDDLNFENKSRLKSHSKNKDFHLLNFPIDNEDITEKIASLNIDRLDYGFFITDETLPNSTIGKGVVNFIKTVSDIKHSMHGESKHPTDRPRLAFVSSINLYGKSYNQHERILKEAEVKFAHGVKHFKLNGRIVRLSEIFGPAMDLSKENPLSLLIQAALTNRLNDVPTSLDFTERSLYIDDAVSLIAKSVLSGATAGKIYDGALLHPVKLSDIKQVLADLSRFEDSSFEISKLPEWPTPNLLKTIKELSWSPKTPVIKALKETVLYFKENHDLVPQPPVKPNFTTEKNWSFSGTGFLGDEEKSKSTLIPKDAPKSSNFDKDFKEHKKTTFTGKSKRFLTRMALSAILFFGLLWPFVFFAFEGFNLRNNLLASRASLETGDFDRAQNQIKLAQGNINSIKTSYGVLNPLSNIPYLEEYYKKGEKLIDLGQEGVEGIYYATTGSRALFQTTKIISGESREDPREFYASAEKDLDFASEKLSKVYAGISDPNLTQGLPEAVAQNVNLLKDRLGFYLNLVDQTQSASSLMPKITGLEGKKSYLVLLQNNLELRPTGGFIGSYAKLDFENGRLTNIKVDDIYNLDGALKEAIAPPAELRQDLNQERLYLRDSNYDPDFPTSARQASFLFKKEAGESVHGVIALDLTASGNLLDAVGGLDLPEYGESVSGANLFERAISHAETGFFPGSQAKKNYLTSLQTQMFNKIFYLSKQNWPAVVQAIAKSLEQKHMLVYLEDPSLFSYLASSNWSGVFPRGAENREGEINDFLAVIESNMGANKSNYFLQRKLDLKTSFTKEGKIAHQLTINYKNTSPSEIFPAGIYKNRFKIYLPQGALLTKATYGEFDITSSFTPLSDYGRTGFSTLLQVMPKEQKQLVLNYELPTPLNFKDNEALYKLQIFKQPGIIADPVDFSLTYPINFKIKEQPDSGTSGVQEVKIQTDLLTDRLLQFVVTK